LNARRFFITAGGPHFQIFTFTQARDGSVYVTWPSFSETKWMSFRVENGVPAMSIVDSPGDGKLSLHGSGMAAMRAHDNPRGHSIVIHGHYLLDPAVQTAGIRHLFTAFITEPKHLPASAFMNRKTDVGVRTNVFAPYVFVFFAVPGIRKLGVNIQASFHVDDLETIPPEFGMGYFGLNLHNIIYFGYRTKHMDRWPQSTYVCYSDGLWVPLILGSGQGDTPDDRNARLEIRRPQYELLNDELFIRM
jgi:hypothetical protein